MFSSFYNLVYVHTLFAKQPRIVHASETTDSSSVLETPVTSVTLQHSIVPSISPRVKALMDDITSPRMKQLSMPSLPIFLPFGRFHLVWNIILFLIITYTLIETPFTVAFVNAASLYGSIYIFALVIDALLLFDIGINFRTAYIDKYDRLRIIHEPKLIAKYYLQTWFIIDVISAFPFTILAIFGSTAQYILLFRLLRLIKLVRIMRILKMFKFFQQQTLHYEARSMLKVFKIFTFMLLTAHYCACFWFFIGVYTYESGMHSWIDTIVEHEDTALVKIPDFTLYSYSMYWSIVTLFTTGYGDIAAHNVWEQWTAMVCILIGSVFFAYFIGMLSSLMSEDRVRGHEHQKIEESLLFCSHYNFPKELTQAIITHIRYYQKYNFVFDKKEIMDSLPSYLQKSVQKHLAKNVLQGLDMFEALSPSIVGKIALKLKSKSINTGHLLFKAGDIGKELYIQRTGKSKLLYGGISAYCRRLKRGDVCGENVIMNRKRLHSVKCETWSEFYVLNIRDIIDILKNNLEPVTAQKEWEKIKQSIRSTMDTSAQRRINDITLTTPMFEEFVTSQIYDSDEVESDGGGLQKKNPVSFKSIQELFNREPDASVYRNQHLLKNYAKQKSDLVIEIPGYRDSFEDDLCNRSYLPTLDDKSDDDSEESGGFGERFGLYKVRKIKKRSSSTDVFNKPPNITIFDDILAQNDSSTTNIVSSQIDGNIGYENT